MATIDIERLAQPIPGDYPSGEDLEYDPTFLELERAARGKPEQQFGDTLVAAEEPDWRTVQSLALDLLGRTKDIRVAIQLTRALLHGSGLTGFSEGLSLLRRLVEQHWDTAHPQLDAEDDNDPTMRVNALVAIQDPEGVLRPLREASMAQAPGLGAASFRDVLIGRNEQPPAADAEPMSMATIDAVFAGADPDSLAATAQAVHDAAADAAALESFISEQVGAHQAPDLSALGRVLRDMDKVFADQLARLGRSGSAAGVEAEQAAGDAEPSALAAAAGGPGISGEVRDRKDVVRALDQIMRYYERHEPSSPVPILLRRAKRLIPMTFLEAVSDLAPDGLSQLQIFSGAEETGEAADE